MVSDLSKDDSAFFFLGHLDPEDAGTTSFFIFLPFYRLFLI
jgi:hypothetical protein